MIDPKDTAHVTDDPTESWKDPRTEGLPEAPLSIHIDAYYQGFHTGITIRAKDNSTIPVTKITTAIELLIEKGFKPSWNQDTNIAHSAPIKSSKGTTVTQHVHNFVTRESKFGPFTACSVKLADGTWCKAKPDPY